MSQESQSPLPPPPAQPTRELVLAQALELCIQAERRVPGSSDLVIGHQPAWARTDLRRLVALAMSLDAVSTNAVMSDEFRLAARARLMEQIGAPVAEWPRASDGTWLSAVPSRNGFHHVGPARSKRWLWRGGGGALLAAVLVTAASLTASANALPGEPLYPVKQAREELGLRFAPDDQARAWALLHQADTRLEETARLLQEGRTQDVAQTTQRFDDMLDRATTTLVVTIAESKTEVPAAAAETRLSDQEQRIQSMLVSAPEPARTDLAQALVAAERSRARVADRYPLGTAADEPTVTEKPTIAASAPTPGVSDLRKLDVRILAPEPAAPPEKHEVSGPRQVQPRAPAQPQAHAAARGDADSNDESAVVVAPSNDGPAQPAEAQRSVSARADDPAATPTGDSSTLDDKPRNQPQQTTAAKPAVVQAQNKTDASSPTADRQGRDASSDAQPSAPSKSQAAPAAKSNSASSSSSNSSSGDDRRPTNGDSGAKGHSENSAAPASHGASDHGGGDHKGD